MANQSIVSISTQDDLCNWEFVDQFDIESDDDVSINYDVQSVDSIDEDDDDDEKQDSTNEEDSSIVNDRVANDVVFTECVRVSDLGKMNVGDHNHKDVNVTNVDVDLLRLQLKRHDFEVRRHEFVNGDEEEDDEEEDEDEEYDFDDELVPWEVKDRFVRQRIRKSGKISCGRTARLKKSALVFTRPGCVRGKHSLGLKVY